MKAVWIEQFGGPEVLTVADIPMPELRDDEILVELEAAGVNRMDLLVRSGGYHRGGQPPLVPGAEGSGIVRKVGAKVASFIPGDRVLGFGGRPGFYAQYVAVPERHLVRRPHGLDPPAAAALPTAWLSAWYCLRYLARPRPGERALVYAAASGVGDAAVQIAKHLGAEVIAVAGSDAKAAWALDNGADHAINYARQDVPAVLSAMTNGEGVEVVLDAVGGRVFAEALRAVGHGGRVVALANVALEASHIDTRDFYPKNVTIYGFQITSLMERAGYDPRGDLSELADLAAEGQFHIHVDQVFPLERAAQAHHYVEARRNRGKVVLMADTG
jgi:NADPH2:quinone reductase